jgi:hypothetical protein
MRTACLALLITTAALAQAPEGYIYRANENAFWLSKTDPEYRHAPPEAVERWRDWKFGLRIHWGLYSMVAGESATFITRVGGFLGPDTLLFPPESMLQRQPSTTVRDVLRDVFALRNTVAHGQEIPKTPYREPHRLLSTHGEQINAIPYSYAELMLDASQFMLTTALHRILTEGLSDTFQNTKTWRQQLTIYARRYKEAVRTHQTAARSAE